MKALNPFNSAERRQKKKKSEEKQAKAIDKVK
jgi:hypothetical protein